MMPNYLRIYSVKLRNPQKDFTFATVRGSSVDMYFKSQVELDTIYRTMEGRNVDTVEEGIQSVKSGALKAFIWDSARLNYEASRDCDLVTTGDVFGRVGYGLAMKKGNPWIYELSQAVLSFHERNISLDAKSPTMKEIPCESFVELGLIKTALNGVYFL
ncbi:Glutamate [NMDA] receptor subunit [Echinococcus granulosus]|uniref:Glutamate [NMDA] receptor subunit n=1 Tax=Echinococcus granulosus TaxID=6210 RepID=W6UXD6_ECHGR|nr:Glutamate [NMDA] receptor subunit [Echinococcus granulosus]EUB63212.1 Glutamate [NMDA] receptor subunit [Echinococcus granulosus]